MAQQFCLKWNNHMNNMMDVFKNLLSTESMVDVTLACDGLSLKAHKIVLSACSPFFQSLFLENPCKHPIVILKDMKYSELKAIIEFMYHGEVNVAQDQLSALMKTAETLRVKGLAEMPNEKSSSNASQEEPGHRSVPRTETPPPSSKRRRGRVRKRSLSDSNRSDDSNETKIKQPPSPDIEELSGDVTMDTSGQFSNLQSQVPMQSLPSHSTNSYQKTSSVVSQDPQIEEPASADESEFGVEPAKLLEQTLTTDDLSNARRSGRSSVSGMEMQRRPRSSTDHSSNLVPTSMPSEALGSNQQPESPPDIKPELLELDPPMSPVAGPSHSTDNSMMMYMDQSSVSSHPGTSYQDNTALVPQDSQPQGKSSFKMLQQKKNLIKTPYVLLHRFDLHDFGKNISPAEHVLEGNRSDEVMEGSDFVSDPIDSVVENVSKSSNFSVGHVPIQGTRRRCVYCPLKGNKKRTKWQCITCGLSLCYKKSGETCFHLFHSQNVKSSMKPKLTTSKKNLPDILKADYSEDGLERKMNDSDIEHISKGGHVPLRGEFKKRCTHCTDNGKIKYTVWACEVCNVPLCMQEKGATCFEIFHLGLLKSVEDGSLTVSCEIHQADDYVPEETAPADDSFLEERAPDHSLISDRSYSDDGLALAGNHSHIKNVSESSPSDAHLDHVPLRILSRRLCVLCKIKGKSSRTEWQCKGCDQPLCRQRTGLTCFHLFHSPAKKVKKPEIGSLLQAFGKSTSKP